MKLKWNRKALPALMLALLLVLPVWAGAEATPEATQTPETIVEPSEQPAQESPGATAEPAETDAADETQQTMGSLEGPHEPLTARAKAFTFSKPTRAALIKYYTAIRLHGIEQTVYVFTDKEGTTQFRVYGRAPDAKRGFYVATVMATVSDGAAGWDFSLDVPDTKPIRDAQVFALYKAKNLPKEEVPAGLRKGSGTGMYYFFNVFGKRESMAWASADGENYAWYLPNGSRPLAGSPKLDDTAFAARMHNEGDDYYRVPKELNGGYAKQVVIVTTDGKTATVFTDKPAIVMDDLVAR